MRKIFTLLFVLLGSIVFAFDLNVDRCESNTHYMTKYIADATNAYHVQYHPYLPEINQELKTSEETGEYVSDETNISTSTGEKRSLFQFISDHLVSVVIIVLIIWLGAICLSKTTSCVILNGWGDLIILIIGGCIFTYFLWIGETIPFLTFILVLSLLISASLSVIGNLKTGNSLSLLFIVISIVVKFLLIMLTPLLILALIGAFNSGEKDGRYRDGTKNNEKTAIIIVVCGLIGALVIPLVKTKEKNEENIDEISEG